MATGDIVVRWAGPADLDFVRQDGYLPADVVAGKIRQGEVAIAERNGRPLGYLRLEYLWSLVPFIALIWVVEDVRRQGVGSSLLRFAETWLRDRGHPALYSSSQADEAEPQAWHRHMGFEECGIISGMNPGGVGELFFRKLLR